MSRSAAGLTSRSLPLQLHRAPSSTQPRPPPHISSSLHHSLCSLLHHHAICCQQVGSPTMSLAQRKKLLKELLAALRSSTPTTLLALSLFQTVPDLPLSFPALLDAVLRLLASDRAEQKKATAEVWDALRWLVESSERFGRLLVSEEADLVSGGLVRELKTLLSGGDVTRLELCAVPATYVLAAVVSHGLYVRRVSAASLAFFFRFYGLAYRALLASKDGAAFQAFTAREKGDQGRSFLACATNPPPAALMRVGSACAAVLCGLIEHYPHELHGWWEDLVFPFMESLVAMEPLAGDYSSTLPAFASLSFAQLLQSFTRALRRHHALLFTSTAARLPAILSSLIGAWPASQGNQSPATIQVKQVTASLLSFAFSLQLLHPHLSLAMPLTSLTRLCLLEMRRPLLFTLQGDEVVERMDSSAAHLAILSLDPATERFIQLSIDSMLFVEWRDWAEEARTADAQPEGKEEEKLGERMEEEKQLGRASSDRSASPTGDEISSKKSRRIREAEQLSAPSPASPLHQVLSGFSAGAIPSLAHFYFLYLMCESARSSSFFFSSAARRSLLLAVLQQLAHWMLQGKTLQVRLWSLACTSSLAAACRHFADQWLSDSRLKAAWDEISSLAVKQLVHDDKRAVSQQSVALLAALLHYELLPAALYPALLPLLAELPRLLTAPSAGAASHGGPAMDSASMKEEKEDGDELDGSSRPVFAYPSPAADCDAIGLRFLTACFTRLPPSALPPRPPTDSSRQSSGDSRGANSLYEMLLQWIVRAPATPLPGAPLMEWTSAAVLALLRIAPPEAVQSFLASEASWRVVQVSWPSSPSSLVAAAAREGRLLELELSSVDFDSVAALEAVVHAAEFSRLIPLPSSSSPSSSSSPPPLPVPSADDDVLVRRSLHSHLVELGRALPAADEEPSNAHVLHHTRQLLRFLRICIALPPSQSSISLVAHVLVQFTACLRCISPSPSSLAELLSLLSLYESVWLSFPAHFDALVTAQHVDGRATLTALSGALQELLCSLLEQADDLFSAGERNEARSRQHSATKRLLDGGESSEMELDDFALAGEERQMNLSSLPTVPLSSSSSYHPTLLLLYHLLLAALKAEAPLEKAGCERMKAYTESSACPAFVLPLLFLLSLQDCLVQHSNLLLLLSLRRVCDFTSARFSASTQPPTKQQPSQTRKRGRADSADEEELGEASTGGREDEDLALSAAAFFLRLCQCVRGGWIVLGVDTGEEDVVRGYTTTILSSLFPQSSTASPCPAGLAALLRCLCCQYGLDAGLLTSWSLPSSLFPMLTSEPSCSSRCLVSVSVSSFAERTTDVEKLWVSSSAQLCSSLDQLASKQTECFERGELLEGRRCDEVIWTMLGCLCALSTQRLAWERSVLLRMCAMYGQASEDSRWVVRSLLQQMAEALGYTPVAGLPPPFLSLISPGAHEPTADRPSLFTLPHCALLEEHVHFLLIEWMSAPHADLRAFPFELFHRAAEQQMEAQEAAAFLPVHCPPLASSLQRFMPQLLSACLLNLAAHEKTLKTVAGLVNTSLGRLLTLHFPAFFAWCYALYSSPAAETKLAQSIIAFLKRELPDKALPARIHSCIPALLAYLLDLAALDPQHTVLPVYGVEEWKRSVIQLSRQRDKEGTCSAGEWLCGLGEGCVVHLLLHVRTRVYSAYRRERQWRWLTLLHAIISELLDGGIAQGYVLRMVLDVLLGLLDESVERFKEEEDAAEGPSTVARWLGSVLQRVLTVAWQGTVSAEGEKRTSSQTDLSADELGRHLRYVFLTLIRFAGEDEGRQAAVAPVLRSCLDLIPPLQLQQVTAPLLLIADHPCMAKPHSPASPATLSSLVSSFLLCLDDLTDQRDTSCVMPLLRSLLARLQAGKDELARWLEDLQQMQREEADGQAASLPRLLAILLALSKPACPAALRELCAQCLAVIGFIDPLRIKQRHAALFQPARLSSASSSSSSSTEAPSFFSPVLARWYQLGEGLDLFPTRVLLATMNPAFHALRHYHHYILYLLSMALRSSSILQQHIAYATLLVLFTSDAQPLMHSAYQQLSPEVQLYLAPFQVQGASRRAHKGDEADDRVMSIRGELASTPAEESRVRAVCAGLGVGESGLSAALWQVRGRRADDWLPRLLFQLLRTSVSDRVLRRLKDLVLFDAALALHVFPLAVMDVVAADRAEWSVQLAACFSLALHQCVDMAREAEDVLPWLSPLLYALQYVREQQLLLCRQPVAAPPKPSSASSLPSALSADQPSPAPPPAPPRPHSDLQLALTSFFTQLDCLLVAEAACSVRWYAAALQWIEQWNEPRPPHKDQQPTLRDLKRKRSGSPSLELELSGAGSQERASATADPAAARYHVLLLRVYSQLEDPDGVYGALQCIPHSLSSSLATDLLLAEHSQDWTTALTIHDSRQSPGGVCGALQQLQCHHLLADYAKLHPAAHSEERQMEMAWRNQQWEEPHETAKGEKPGFHGHLYRALVALRSSSSPSSAVLAARVALLEQIKSFNPERVNDVFPFLVQLQMLREVDHPHSPGPVALPSRRASCDAFELVEPLLALQSTLLSMRPSSLSAVISHLCETASLAREAEFPLLVARLIRSGAARLQAEAGPAGQRHELLEMRLQLRHAEMVHARGGVDGAIRELKSVMERLQRLEGDGSLLGSEHEHFLRLTVDVNAHLGQWLSESHSESAERVCDFFSRALSSAQLLAASFPCVPASSPSYELGAHHFALGSFHDRQFQSLLQKKQSSEWQARRAHFERQSEAISQDRQKLLTPEAQAVLSSREGRTERWLDLKKLERLLQQREKEHEMDARDYQQLDDAYTAHLHAAIAHYQDCLAASSQHDTFALYRFCALWFNHDRYSPPSAAKSANQTRFTQLPSYKFIPLIYQLAARLLPIPTKASPAAAALPDTERTFRKQVWRLLHRLAVEHPHHSLFPLFALSAGGQVERVAGSFNSAFESNNERIAAAAHLLATLKREPSVRDLLAAQERLIAAYVELGNRKYKKEDKHVALKDTQLDRLSRKELALIAVPTLSIPISASSAYSGLPSIVRFDSTFHFATAGINKPLILQLLCSDGRKHKQLLKPSDDLRQDAVMEQLFALVNTLLATSSKQTKRRQMRMRTYNVVPLTPGVGLVEWVQNARSLHDLLVSPTEGAHARFHPPSAFSWTYHQCLQRMRDCTERSEVRARYHEVCSHFPPALRQHFVAHFPAPADWYQARVTFIRSLATTSMIGYIVGLGDRHIQNVLVDSAISEVIHIDLGVAFDMGRLLKTPELVPFRLTRDLVDGMGLGGLDGGFRHGCEEVLRVMRGNAAMVSTLLEVFVYDPLYKWALSPAKLQQLRPEIAGAAGDKQQNAGAAGAGAGDSSPLMPNGAIHGPQQQQMNAGAFRALSAVKHRLSGEDAVLGGSSRLSVEGQVNALIQQATSEELLSQMYWGWSAFC